MKIFIVIKSSLLRLPGIWRSALFVWFSSLLVISIFAFPIKSVVNYGFGRSMITEKLRDGINIEVFSDLGDTLTSLGSYFSSGFLLNAFFSGGFFGVIKTDGRKSSVSNFFKSSAKNFWAFLFISILVNILIVIFALLIIALPLFIVGKSIILSEGSLFKTGIFLFSIFLLVLIILILIADYARAWQVTKKKNQCFRAIGFGIRQTFRTFISSYALMVILLTVQLLFVWLVLKILPGWTPDTGAGIVLLFVLSQFLFFIKIILKVLRYGSVTALMELNLKAKSVKDYKQKKH
jgi:hypothetical protein